MTYPPAILTPQDKADLLTDYALEYPRRVLIETGLYQGWGTGMRIERAELGIETYICLDISDVNCAEADCTIALCGDSGERMPEALEMIHEPALFWLDAHHVEEYDGKHKRMTPLLDELDAILEWPHAFQSVILIDDWRLMGEAGWPSGVDVLARSTRREGNFFRYLWDKEITSDVLRLTPR